MNGVQLSLEVIVPSKSKRARFMGEPHASTRQLGPDRVGDHCVLAVAAQDVEYRLRSNKPYGVTQDLIGGPHFTSLEPIDELVAQNRSTGLVIELAGERSNTAIARTLR